MQIYKLTSSKGTIERFLMSTNSQAEVNEDEARMWLSEIYDLAGVPSIAITKVIGHKQDPAYEFTDWKVPLPCDFKALKPGGISVNGRPVRWAQNSFHYLLDGECCDLPSLNSTSLDTFTDNFGTVFSPSEGITSISAGYPADITFNIEDGWITFNVKSGKCCLAYWSYPVDNENYLMIPDTTKFKRACADYLRYKTDYILWRQGLITDSVFKYSDAEKDWSLGSAKAELLMPDDYQLSSMQRSLIRLMPIQESIGSFYKNLGQQEQGFRRRY